MRQRTLLIVLAVLIPAAFLAGSLAQRGGDASEPGDRQVLYYVDPMNPSFRSPEPGTAPCGMPLEPVYADGSGPGGAAAALPERRVSQRRPAAAGRVSPARRSRRATCGTRCDSWGPSPRTRPASSGFPRPPGGRVREMGAATTGSLVAKGEVLGAYYATELLVPQQNYLRMYETYLEVQQTGSNPRDNFQGGGQLATYWRNVDVARQSLMNLGMSAQQIEEVSASHQPAYLVQMRAPAAGVVTARNVVLGQSFEAGEELYAIADLSRAWVLADVFEGQEQFFTPGLPATVTLPGAGRRFAAEGEPGAPAFRRRDAHPQGPSRGRQPRPRPATRHVRGRRASRASSPGCSYRRRRCSTPGRARWSSPNSGGGRLCPRTCGPGGASATRSRSAAGSWRGRRSSPRGTSCSTPRAGCAPRGPRPQRRRARPNLRHGG